MHVKKSLPEGLDREVRSRASLMAVASHEAVHADLAHDACGDRGETMLELRLQEAGLCRDAYLAVCKDFELFLCVPTPPYPRKFISSPSPYIPRKWRHAEYYLLMSYASKNVTRWI